MLGTVDLWQFREIILVLTPSFCREVPLSGWLFREGTCPEVVFGLPFVGFFVLLLSAISFVFFWFKFLGQITAHRFGLIASSRSRKKTAVAGSALSVSREGRNKAKFRAWCLVHSFALDGRVE